jgi:hypothetical protein
MSKVFISRQDGNVSWGFRLQGGLEFNEPLTVTNVSVFIWKKNMLIIQMCIHKSEETGKQLFDS